MNDFIKWWNARNKNSKHMLDDINQASQRVCKLAFNAGAAAQIEKDAARAETFVHDDWGKLMLECGKDIAAAIRDQLKVKT